LKKIPGLTPRILGALTVALAASAFILYSWPTPTIWYEGFVLLHLLLGVALLLVAIPCLGKLMRQGTVVERMGWIVLLVGGALGAAIIYTGARRQEWDLLYSHILISVLACAIFAFVIAGRRGWLAASTGRSALRFALCLAIAAGIAAGSWWLRSVPWNDTYAIRNPAIAPANMDQEGAGPKSQFFPSSGETLTGKTVPQSFFLDSQACQRCHADIYREWRSSMHHFSSFNNQWYRQAIVYMQDTVGVEPSKWCAGCHDAALFFPGNFNTPIASRIHTPAAQAGIGCMVCHSFRMIKSTMGNGDYILQYPALSKLVATKNKFLQHFIDFMIEEDPDPHRRTFFKPFMRTQTAEYCSVCHKVHLDVSVNHYRWVRGFDDYDNWQASGVSGLGARSFYYPPQPESCENCHMPLTASNDAGNIDGFIHNHRFVAANTAVPYVNEDETQLKDVENFLKDGKVRVDIFAISPDKPLPRTGARTIQPEQPQIETTFAVGEESEMAAPSAPVPTIPPQPVTAPLDRVNAAVRAGDTVRVDVVVRTLGVGHFFPGGTVDAFDCWLELQATDDKGRVIFWSGGVEAGGRGAVDPSAHFYRALLIDAHGNPITRRNAWAERATVYVHLIPPGAADTVHYRLRVPKDEKGPLHLLAKLNYRKFSWINTQFAFAGVLHDTHRGDFAPGYDDREVTYNGDLRNVSGKIKAIPNLPIVTMAQASVDLKVLPASAPEPKPQTSFDVNEWQRWNDYGIGLLLEGDLKGAEDAFREITKNDPSNPDGWVNVGRARVLEGDISGAQQVLAKALEIAPKLARANYFYARVLMEQGEYAGALRHFRVAAAQYPEDRVVSDDIGRVMFLEHKYGEAVAQFEHTISIDPEDLEANYNLMLCYTGLGNSTESKAFEVRYLRFKADEASETLTGPYRAKHPYDNLERQQIHEHDSGDIASFTPKAASPGQAAAQLSEGARRAAPLQRASRAYETKLAQRGGQ
jgi:tetratricopeptide (TPR) repeat protein